MILIINQLYRLVISVPVFLTDGSVIHISLSEKPMKIQHDRLLNRAKGAVWFEFFIGKYIFGRYTESITQGAKMKVLLIYPNLRCMNMLPPAIGLLSSILKDEGHNVLLFDTTYYEKLDGSSSEADSDHMKTEKLMARPFKMPNEITLKTTNPFEDFRSQVKEFQPDLLAMSATEDMFLLGIRLLRTVQDLNIPTILGGVFATFAPHVALKYPEIDMVCVGEGELALKTLCERMEKGLPYEDINNLWFKNPNGSIRKMNPTRMVNMDDNPLIDMTIFEEARFYRPMGGRVWRMFPVETHRGCPYTCTYCNSPSQMELYKKEEGASFLRRKSFENMRKELLYYKEEMGAEYLYFWADTFFSWKAEEFEEFCEIYQDIGLPFWCQTRAETITYERLKKLRDIGCARISFGLEHGNEQFRKKVLLRRVTNDTMIKNFKILNDLGIPYSVNNIIGFPDETRELAMDTVELNRQIDATDRNAYAFTPFNGVPLRAVSERQNLVEPGQIVSSIFVNGTILNMPQFPPEQINGLIKTFNMYVKFPKSRWKDIEKAESDTPEGNRIYNELKQEFIDKYWDATQHDFEGAALENELGAPMNN